MKLYEHKGKSLPQKIVIHILEIFFIWLSYEILFKGVGALMAENFGILNASHSTGRRIIVFVFSVITFIRLAFMMFYLLRRGIPWGEAISVPLAFAIYYIGFSLFVLPTTLTIDCIDILGIAIFLIGSSLNTTAEVLRDKWKSVPENAGKIYTGGLFAYSMHINYFGDLLWVSAYAILTRNIFSISIPVFIFCFFAFYNIPKLDKHLHEHYGKGFEEYARRTKKFIPFIY
jgi:protein-S-isoprenylcysteine O-methyltransferase Ste14